MGVGTVRTATIDRVFAFFHAAFDRSTRHSSEIGNVRQTRLPYFFLSSSS
jgi:hypothetical protein